LRAYSHPGPPSAANNARWLPTRRAGGRVRAVSIGEAMSYLWSSWGMAEGGLFLEKS